MFKKRDIIGINYFLVDLLGAISGRNIKGSIELKTIPVNGIFVNYYSFNC